MANRDLELEKELWDRGYIFVAGIDEAGRGPWAGPVVAASAIFPPDHTLIEGVNDSKKITEKRRNEIDESIRKTAVGFGYGIVSSEVIDQFGIAEAVRFAMFTSVHGAEKMIGNQADYLVIDGAKVRDLEGYEQRKVDRADQIYYSVAAASILAKVKRDTIMINLSDKYPEYGFESHKGYGTKKHSEALQKHGPTKIHRFSYKPVKKIAAKFISEG